MECSLVAVLDCIVLCSHLHQRFLELFIASACKPLVATAFEVFLPATLVAFLVLGCLQVAGVALKLLL